MPPAPSPQLAAAVTRLLARTDDPGESLAGLHALARDFAHGSASLTARQAPEGDGWELTSSDREVPPSAPPILSDGPGARAAARAAAGTTASTLLALARDAPDLAAVLRTPAALLVPLSSRAHPGLLVVGVHEPARADLSSLAAVADGFVLALERADANRQAALQADVQSMLRSIALKADTPAKLPAALAGLCRGSAELFGASRAEVWQHDRRAHEIVLSATSDPARATGQVRVPTSDDVAPAAVGLRRERAGLLSHAGSTMLVVPLRGRRRALGTLVFDDVRLAPSTVEDTVSRADEIGLQLAPLLENVQLVDEVVRSRAELENVFDSLADLVIVCNAGGRVTTVNRAFLARVGLSRSRVRDRALSALVGPQIPAWLAQQTNAFAVAHAEQIDDRVLGGVFAVTRTPLASSQDASPGYVLVARDVTEHAALERRLVLAEKLAALGQFVAGIAHELNNPLQGALGHLELLRAGRELPAGVQRDLNRVYRETDRAARIVRDLLVFAGSGRLRTRRLNPNAIAARVLRLRSRALRTAGIDVVRALDETLPTVRGDGLLLQQALLNVVLNAEQVMPSGGTLVVSSATADAGNAVQIAVEDTGPGLSPEVQRQVFDPFFTTKDVGSGTGLGLAIAYGILQAHGGRLEAGNRSRDGARFVLTIPLAPPTVPMTAGILTPSQR
jgi:PAS domain S-box-containing protein